MNRPRIANATAPEINSVNVPGSGTTTSGTTLSIQFNSEEMDDAWHD